MPEAGFNRDLNLPTGNSNYIRLKAKGDKVKFLIASKPHYETKHWIGDRETVLCEKYNSDDKKAKCQNCQEWQKQLEAAGEDKKKVEQANKLKPSVTFYYPILDLKQNISAIFQTAPSVHWTIVGYAEEKVDVFACAWTVERTEEPGNYYVTRRLDAVKLNEEQEEELAKAKLIKLNKGKESKSVVEQPQ